jgi:hypothetical protein
MHVNRALRGLDALATFHAKSMDKHLTPATRRVYEMAVRVGIKRASRELAEVKR